MANFVQGRFVIPVTPEDNNVQIKDKNGRIRYTVAPNQITAVFVNANLIKIKKKGTNDIISLDFGSPVEAKIALNELQDQIDIARLAAPLKIDPLVTNYIDSKILELSSKMSFMYHQVSSDDVWSIGHDFGYKPNVTVVDENLEEIEGLVKYIDNDTLTISFNQNITGWVFLS